MPVPFATVAAKAGKKLAKRAGAKATRGRYQRKRQQQRKRQRVTLVIALIVVVSVFFSPLATIMMLMGALGGGTAGTAAALEEQSGNGNCAQDVTIAGTANVDVDNLSKSQIRNAQTIIAQGKRLGLPKRAWQTAVMVAWVESKMRALDHGHADSQGMFQQRPSSGWGSPKQVRDPKLSTLAFYGKANHTNNPGLTDISGWRNKDLPVLAQRVQRSAFPYRYAEAENLAAQIISEVAGTATVASGANCGPGAQKAMSCPRSDYPNVEEGLKPDGLRVLRCGSRKFPKISTWLGAGERSANSDSDHPSGRAVDAMISSAYDKYKSKKAKEYGWKLAKWARKNASGLGVKYVIYYGKIWSRQRSDEGWRSYDHPSGASNDTSAHRDHVHISVYGNKATTAGNSEWTLPIRGNYEVSSGFGSKGYSGHDGQDMSTMQKTGKPVVAASDGVIIRREVECGGTCSYGRWVQIWHGDGKHTLYAHLESFASGLDEGSKVKAGQIIGYSGNAGNSTGPHLHLQLTKGGTKKVPGTPTDPVPWFASQGVDLLCNKHAVSFSSNYGGRHQCAT